MGISRTEYYLRFSAQERAENLVLFQREPPLVELLDWHLGQLSWLIATANSRADTRLDPDMFHLIKTPKKKLTPQEIGAALLSFGKTLPHNSK